ncbi:hypothetical protein ACIP8U_44770 [Streptomyces pseudovenezuelae]
MRTPLKDTARGRHTLAPGLLAAALLLAACGGGGDGDRSERARTDTT